MSFTAKCPVIFHFGREDHAIPPEEVEIIRVSQPDNHVYLYPAGHGLIVIKEETLSRPVAKSPRNGL